MAGLRVQSGLTCAGSWRKSALKQPVLGRSNAVSPNAVCWESASLAATTLAMPTAPVDSATGKGTASNVATPLMVALPETSLVLRRNKVAAFRFL
jgi:hypothetical protein